MVTPRSRAPKPVEEPQAPLISRGYANYVLGVLFVVYVFNFIDRQILSILLEPIKLELGASDTAMGFLTGIAFALFYTFAGIPIARWADRGTRRTVIAIGLVLWSLMTAASGLVRSFAQLAVARIGVGVGEAACSPPAHSLISDYFPPERRATALSIYAMGIHFGFMFGFLAGGWINEFFGWRLAFMVVGIPGLGLALLLRLTVREPPRGYAEGAESDAELPSTAETFRFMWGLRSFRHLSFGAALHAFAGYGFGTWTPAFLIRVHDMGTGEVGTWLGLMTGFGGGLGAFLGGYLCDRVARDDARWYLWLPAGATILAIPALLLFLLLPNQVPALLCYIPAVIFGAAWLGPTFSITQGLVKLRMRAMASAILLFIINLIGLGLGPQAVGIMNDLMAQSLGVEAIRYSLLLVAFTNVWAATHFVLAARTLRADLLEKNA